jgi:hypothetical protein
MGEESHTCTNITTIHASFAPPFFAQHPGLTDTSQRCTGFRPTPPSRVGAMVKSTAPQHPCSSKAMSALVVCMLVPRGRLTYLAGRLACMAASVERARVGSTCTPLEAAPSEKV